MSDEAARLIGLLGLMPHPEGGHYREIFRDPSGRNGRPHSTAILYLLRGGESSRWHRIDAVEIWHYYRGAPLELGIGRECRILGCDIEVGQAPQIVVPANTWQSARTLGAYTLMGCTVAPGFEFSKFELAPEGFEP